MVSGFNTSPKLLSRILSGEAKLMVICEKDGLGLLSLLNAISLMKICKLSLCTVFSVSVVKKLFLF